MASLACTADREESNARLVEVTPFDRAASIDVAPDLVATLRFDRPMASGVATLASDGLNERVAVVWDSTRTNASIPIGTWVTPGSDYELVLSDFTDDLGQFSHVDDVAPDSRIRFATAQQAGSEPVVLTVQPRPDQFDVYPAQVDGGTAPHVAITVQFDDEMDPIWNTVLWRPLSSENWTAVEGRYSADARTFRAAISAPPFTGKPPLSDATGHEIELVGLRNRDGNAPSDRSKIPRRLRFTTGTFDSLLNHSCGHVTLGPFASVAASAARGPAIPATDTPHTRYTVALPVGYDAAFTRFRAATSARVHLFVDGDAEIGIEREDQTALAVERTPTPAACRGISTRQSFSVTAADRLWFRIPAEDPEVRFIVELVTP